MTVDNAGTPWHPQFFRPVTFESQRLTHDSHMFTHGTVMFELASLVNQHFCQSHAYSLFTMSFTLPYHRLVQLSFRHVVTVFQGIGERKKFSHLTICATSSSH